LRREGLDLPILVLTARDSLSDMVDSLNIGADDFMTKPFHLVELIARLRALVRRSHSKTSSMLSFGPIELDISKHTATLRGLTLDLTGREWAILEMLMLQALHLIRKDRLLQSLCDADGSLSPNAIEIYISRLRSKLAPTNIHIRTVRGIGYRLDEPLD
jgi:DNA-binding response OmpR family regulator